MSEVEVRMVGMKEVRVRATNLVRAVSVRADKVRADAVRARIR